MYRWSAGSIVAAPADNGRYRSMKSSTIEAINHVMSEPFVVPAAS